MKNLFIFFCDVVEKNIYFILYIEKFCPNCPKNPLTRTVKRKSVGQNRKYFVRELSEVLSESLTIRTVKPKTRRTILSESCPTALSSLHSGGGKINLPTFYITATGVQLRVRERLFKVVYSALEARANRERSSNEPRRTERPALFAPVAPSQRNFAFSRSARGKIPPLKVGAALRRVLKVKFPSAAVKMSASGASAAFSAQSKIGFTKFAALIQAHYKPP